MSSCTFYEPEYRGGESIRFGQLNGRDVKFNAGAKVYNENGFAIKIKPCTLDLYIEGEYMGKVHLDEKFKMKSKCETTIDAPFTATLEKGALFRAMKFANKEEVQVRLSGKVKAGVWIFGKKIDVNETRTISGSNLKFL
jgi:LEA14-like dessication related protein